MFVCSLPLCHFNISPQLLVLSQVDKVLDEVDWLIARKKNHTSDKSGSGKKLKKKKSMLRWWKQRCIRHLVVLKPRLLCVAEDSQAPGQQDPVEKAVTLQLGTLLTALNELVQTALQLGTCTLTLLRELSRTYTTLTTLVKYVCICLFILVETFFILPS